MLLLLILLTIISLFIGVSELSIKDIFHLSDSQQKYIVLKSNTKNNEYFNCWKFISFSWLIMQQMMQNKFVSPTTAGTMEWAKLGILIALLFFPTGHILLKLVFAVICSISGTFLFVKIIDFIKVKDVIFVPLLGIMMGGIVASFTTFISLRTNAVQSIGNWLNGNFAIITSGRYEILYLSIPLLALTYLFANHFTIVGMGKDFTNNLGLSYEKLINVALFITATITALVVVTVGTLPFLGLVIPNIISIYRGDHLKNAIPHTMMLGAIFVLFSDIVGRVIVYPYEINIGLTIGVFGTIIFLILLMKVGKIMRNNNKK